MRTGESKEEQRMLQLSPEGYVKMEAFLKEQMEYWEEEGNSGDVGYIQNILDKLHEYASVVVPTYFPTYTLGEFPKEDNND